METQATKQRVCGLFVMLLCVMLQRLTFAEIYGLQEPAEPVAPTDERECRELDHQYYQLWQSIAQKIDVCLKDSQPPTRVNYGPCQSAKEGYSSNISAYPHCEPLYEQRACLDLHRDEKVKRCREAVRLSKLRQEVEDKAVDMAKGTIKDKIVEEVVPEDILHAKEELFDPAQGAWETTKKWKERWDQFQHGSSRGRADALYDSSHDFARGVYDLSNPNPLAKALFGGSMEKLSEIHKSLPQQLEEASRTFDQEMARALSESSASPLSSYSPALPLGSLYSGAGIMDRIQRELDHSNEQLHNSLDKLADKAEAFDRYEGARQDFEEGESNASVARDTTSLHDLGEEDEQEFERSVEQLASAKDYSSPSSRADPLSPTETVVKNFPISQENNNRASTESTAPQRAASSCPEDLSYLNNRFRVPELPGHAPTSGTAMIQAAGGVDRAIKATQAQIQEYRRVLIELRSIPVSERLSEHNQAMIVAEDVMMSNEVALSAFECHRTAR